MSEASQVVMDYLTAFTSGDVDKALSFVSDDFSFRGPMQQIIGKKAFSAVLAHVATGAHGFRMLRQWESSDNVCSVYEFNVKTPSGPVSLLVSEWNTVWADKVASSVMIFDTGAFRTLSADGSQVIDPVCGMTVDPTTAPAHRKHADRDYYFCSTNCAERFDAEPNRYLAKAP